MPPRAPFAYFRDPVCLCAAGLYVLNRSWLTPLFVDPDAFVRCYFGDVMCLPVSVPVVLWLQRRCGLRGHDLPPSVGELLLHWLLWSFCFEWLGPRLPALAPGAVGDPWDAVAYAAGGVVAGAVWRSPLRPPAADLAPRPAVLRALLALSFALLVLGAYRASAALR